MSPEKILDFIWPRRCEICGGLSDRPSRHVCSECLMKIPFLPQTGCCDLCGLPVEGYKGEFVCDECRRRKTFFDKAVSAARMEGELRRMLIGFKFDLKTYLADDFADWMEAALKAKIDACSIDLAIPLPLTFPHRIDRGYNQSAYLARRIAKRLGRTCREDLVIRKGSPQRQSLLSGTDREENVKGTFAAAKPEFIRGRTVLVVDDVMTTGSTLNEISRELKTAGAWRIVCLTLAKAIPLS